MNKELFLVLGTAICLFATGCSVSTPYGSVQVEETGIAYTDKDGDEKSLRLANTKEYVDKFLSSVNVPNMDNEEFKKEVYKKLEENGIDLDNIDNDSKEEIAKIKKVISETLKENGVDTNKLNMNIENFFDIDNKDGDK